MAATSRHEMELKYKAKQQLQKCKDPVEKLRYMCLQRGAAGIQGLARSFRIFDDNRDKKLDLEELRTGLNDYGIHLDEADLKDIFDTLDRDKGGSIDFDEFLRAIRPKMNKSRTQIVHEAFRKLDRTGDGIVTVEDLRGVYSVKNNPKYINGEMTDEELLGQFLDNFDTPGKHDRTITLPEFENYYSGLSASIDSDCYFDLVMRNAWKL